MKIGENCGLLKKKVDPNMYLFLYKRKYVMLLLYINDLLLIGDYLEKINRIIIQFIKEFKIINLGLTQLHLKAKIMQKNKELLLHQHL